MGRDVPFDAYAPCDSCGQLGAWDFMGDLICQGCLDKTNPEASDFEENQLKFQVTRGGGSCECCGHYEWERVEVFHDGELILDHRGDDHLSGNLWSNWEEFAKELFPKLGYAVEIDDITPFEG